MADAILDATPSAAPSDARHSARFPDEHEERFAHITSIPAVVDKLLEALEAGGAASARADTAAHNAVIEQKTRANINIDYSVINTLETIRELLGPFGWNYAIEAGLKRIAELAATATPLPAGRFGRRDAATTAAAGDAVDTEILYTLNTAENYTAEMREAFQAIESHAFSFDGATDKDRAIYLSSILALVERGVSRAHAMNDALASVVERLVKGGAA